MRKLFTFCLLFIIALTGKSEIWFDAGVKGGFVPGVFTNSQILDSKTQSLGFPTGYLAGAKVGINFGLKHSITIDGHLTNSAMKVVENGNSNYRTTSLTSFDLPILYRVNQDNGGYAEIGPQWSFTQSASITTNTSSTEATDRFNSTNVGIAFGFGQYVGGGDAFGINVGFRGAYIFSDIVASSAHNQALDPIYQPVGAEEFANYAYQESGRLYFGIVVELNLNIGYFTQGAACTKRTKFRMF